MSIKHELAARLGIIYILVLLLSLSIVGKAIHVQVVEGPELRKNVRSANPQIVEVPPIRGDIYASDGRVLASSVPYYLLYMDPVSVNDTVFKQKVDSLALCLSAFYKNASKAYYKEKITKARNRGSKYLLINDRLLSYTEVQQLKKFPVFREKRSNGMILELRNVRQLAHGSLAQRTIGYLNQNNDGGHEGRVGLEGAYEQELRGENGKSIRQMMSGRKVDVPVEEPVDGNDVITTLDVDYQDIVQGALYDQLVKYEAESGTAILMEVKTGDVKAIANLSRRGGAYKEILNNAIMDAGEPGSVFKAAVMIALLEDGYVSPTDTIDLGRGHYTYHKHTIRESTDKFVGVVTVKEIFERSLNGISRLVHTHYGQQPEKFIDRLYAMGLNTKLGIELQGEGEPYIKYPTDKSWSGTTLPVMSIGYEVQMTPLQILAFYNALANGGKRMKPRFVSEIRHRGEVVRKIPTEMTDRSICSKNTLAAMREMMEGVVENGTARNLKDASCKIAGKTGTARIADAAKGYKEKKYQASFVGYFPADEPLYSCIVVIKDPKQGYYGNVVSGSVFKEVADKVYALASLKYGTREIVEGVDQLPVCKNGLKSDFQTICKKLKIAGNDSEAKEANWIATVGNEHEIVMKPRELTDRVPDVRGMGLRDALYLLENSGLKVGVSGSGAVAKQSLAPGSVARKGAYVQLELR